VLDFSLVNLGPLNESFSFELTAFRFATDQASLFLALHHLLGPHARSNLRANRFASSTALSHRNGLPLLFGEAFPKAAASSCERSGRCQCACHSTLPSLISVSLDLNPTLL